MVLKEVCTSLLSIAQVSMSHDVCVMALMEVCTSWSLINCPGICVV